MSMAVGHDTVDWLTAEEAHALFERRCQEILGMSRAAFLAAVENGDFDGREEEAGVRDLLALLSFGTST
jgi:hypothetical protein